VYQTVCRRRVTSDCLPAATQRLAAAKDALEVGRALREATLRKCALTAAGVPPQLQDCVRKANTNTAAIAGCFPDGEIAPSVAAIAGCVQQALQRHWRVRSCVVGTTLIDCSRKLRTAAQCVANSASSGGYPTRRFNVCGWKQALTPAQQIAQCLVQTGPGPQFLVCTGGQLFLGTLSACRNAKFGTDGCWKGKRTTARRETSLNRTPDTSQ